MVPCQGCFDRGQVALFGVLFCGFVFHFAYYVGGEKGWNGGFNGADERGRMSIKGSDCHHEEGFRIVVPGMGSGN